MAVYGALAAVVVAIAYTAIAAQLVLVLVESYIVRVIVAGARHFLFLSDRRDVTHAMLGFLDASPDRAGARSR